MSTFYFTINEYLIDGGPEVGYVLHDPNDPTSRIVTSQTTYAVNTDYRAIGAQIGARSMPALSFNIRRRPNGEWYLMTNQQTFAGKYPSQAACLGVLYGIMTSNDGLDEDGFATYLANALTDGSSTIDASDNVLELIHSGSDITVLLSAFDTSSFQNDLPYFGYQVRNSDGSYIPITISNIALQCAQVTAGDGGSDSMTKTGAWNDIDEGEGARPVLIGFNTNSGAITIVATGAPKQKPLSPALDGISLAPSGVTLDGGTVSFTATATADDNRPLPSDLVYTYTITATLGDTSTVTSSLSSTGRSYTLTYDYTGNADRDDDVLRIEAVASSSSLGASVSETTSATLEYPTNPVIPVIDFDVAVSGTSTLPATAVELNDNAYAVVTNSSTGGITFFSYEWYQSVPTLTGITLTNEGP